MPDLSIMGNNADLDVENNLKVLLSMYEEWKAIVRITRKQLKFSVEIDPEPLLDTFVKCKDILKLRSEIPKHSIPDILRCRVDACEFISKDIFQIVYKRIIDDEFGVGVQVRFYELFGYDPFDSIFGTSSQVDTKYSQHSESMVGGLAMKEAEHKELEKRDLEKRQREELERRDQEEQQRLELERHEREEQQRCEMERREREELWRDESERSWRDESWRSSSDVRWRDESERSWRDESWRSSRRDSRL